MQGEEEEGEEVKVGVKLGSHDKGSRAPKKMTSEKVAKAITMKASGHTFREIAAEVGVTFQGVWGSLSKPEIRAEIEELQKQFLEANLSRAALNMTEIIHSNPEGDKDKELRFRASTRVLESGGLLPSAVPAVYVNTLNQVNTFQSPKVQEVLTRFAGMLAGKGGDVVDAEEVKDVTGEVA